jgi:nucleotide-binding universal stress UspA family protein
MVDAGVHRCPRCELCFVHVVELEDHLGRDHDLDLRRPDKTGPSVEPLERQTTSGKVVVPVDPSRAPGTAVSVAAGLARQAGMALEVVAAPSGGLSRATTDAYLHARVREARAAGAPVVSWRALPGTDVGGAILEHLGTAGSSLVCMATHSRSAVGELVLGSVSEAVVRSAPVPVLLVGPRVLHDPAPIHRIVVAVDGSLLAEEALDVAGEWAGRLSASLSLVEVVPKPLPSETDTGVGPYLRRLAQGRPGGEAEVETLHGPDPAEAVLDWMGPPEGTIVVVATHGRTGLRRLVMGSVALDIVRHALCPVLVVRPATAGGTAARLSGRDA